MVIWESEIQTALCCGSKCKPGPNTGLCHRLDFVTEAQRVMALLVSKGAIDGTRQNRAEGSATAGDAGSEVRGEAEATTEGVA